MFEDVYRAWGIFFVLFVTICCSVTLLFKDFFYLCECRMPESSSRKSLLVVRRSNCLSKSIMDNKVQELANKIYQEGVQKAASEADEILKKAQAQSEKLLSDAKEQAMRLVQDAEKKATEVKDNAEAELRLGTSQAVEALRTQVTDMINEQVVKTSIDKAFADPTMLYHIVRDMANQWAQGQDVLIKTDDAEKLEAFFKSEVKDALSHGVRIEQVAGRSHAFEIQPQNGSYKVVVSKEAFVEYFKDFLRPKLRAFLFGTTQE